MDNVATLGLRVDSTQVSSATTALGGLTNAANTAAPAVAKLTLVAKPAADAHQGLSTQAMAAGHSVRSAVESIIAGASPTQALALQLNHLSYAASGPGGLSGAFKEAGTAITGFVSVSGLVTLGLVGIAAAFGIAIAKVAASEVAFSALSSRLGTTVQDLHALQSAAAVKGIGSDDFTKGMEKFGELTYEASHNMGSLAETFRVAGIASGTLDENFAHAADLIRNAKDDAARYAIIQQLGLPPTAQWVELLKQGSAGIAAAKAEAVALGGVTDEALVKRAKDFDEAWNRGWNNFLTYSKVALINAADLLSKFNEEMDRGFRPKINLDSVLGQGDIGKTPRNLSTDLGINDISRKATVDPNALKNQLSLESQRISVLGNLATVEDTVRQKQIELNLAGIAGASVSKAQQAAILEYTRNLNLGIIGIREQVAQQQILTQQFGMTTGEAAAYAAVQQKINEARIRGAPLHDDEIAKLQKEADALASVVQLNSNLTELKTTSQDALSGFVKDLAAGKTAAQALQGVLQKLENKLIDMATSAIIQNLFKNLLGVTGGVTPIASGTSIGAPTSHSGGIVGSEHGPARNVPMSVFAGAPRFHGGGLVSGEMPIIARQGEGIFTKQQMASLAPAGSGGGNNVVVNVVNNSDGTEVKTQKRSQGGTDFHDIIISTVGKAFANGAFNQPLRALTNTQQQPRPR